MNEQERESTLRDLFRSLDERWRPEDVAQKVVTLLNFDPAERKTVEQAAKAGQKTLGPR
jgi:hypothetical protein